MSKITLREDEKEEIVGIIKRDGLRKAMLDMSYQDQKLHPITIKVPMGYINIVTTAKDEAFKQGKFSSPPNTTDFVRHAIDNLMQKIFPE